MDALLEELKSAAERLRTLLEGYADLLRLDLEVATRSAVRAHNEATSRRFAFLADAIAGLEALVADGHPELPCKEVSLDIRDDMTGTLSSLTLALNEFCERPLTTTGKFTVGPEEPLV